MFFFVSLSSNYNLSTWNILILHIWLNFSALWLCSSDSNGRCFPIEILNLRKLNELLLCSMGYASHMSQNLISGFCCSRRIAVLLLHFQYYTSCEEAIWRFFFLWMICANVCDCIYGLRRYTSFLNVDKFKAFYLL